ncbi:MAG: DUF4386 family protein [Candidatus Lokiarchaeota archaeon]|nr:DUF4386 family protein [Candidatus Lokiarchaeota archaeon]
MNLSKLNAKFVGLFIIITYLSLVISGIILAPLLDAPDILAVIFPNALMWQVGVYVELGNAIGVLGIALFMYPFLKEYHKGLALFYVGIRLVESIFSAIASMSRLLLIDISSAYLDAGSPSNSYYQGLADFALAIYHWAFEMPTVFFLIGAVLFYFLLEQTELVPRYITIWGYIAVIALLILNIFGAFLGVIAFVFALPIITNEIFLAIWLIAKGDF